MITNWPVSIWYEFLQKRFFQWCYWNLDFNYKKIYTKYDKICVFEKNPHENYHRENKSQVEWSRISLLFSKSMPWLVRVYVAYFSIFISHFLDITIVIRNRCCYVLMTMISPMPRWEIDETVYFCNFRRLSINLPVFWHFSTLYSNGQNETEWQDTWNML